MLLFPNCKINLGLHVINKRTDGYHSIETVFYPVNWCDALEVIESTDAFTWSQSGLPIAGAPSENLIYKAWKLISAQKKIPGIAVHLHKVLPMGAGLGGGSSDAAHFIKLLNEKFQLGLSDEHQLSIASQLGADCAFFIKNKAVFAQGKGDEFYECDVDLSNYYILVVFPGIHSNTKMAYEGLTPALPENNLLHILQSTAIDTWKNTLVNDFERTIFKKYPEIKELKENLYAGGALYASLSGSGSSVFGIFDKEPSLSFPKNHLFYLQKPR